MHTMQTNNIRQWWNVRTRNENWLRICSTMSVIFCLTNTDKSSFDLNSKMTSLFYDWHWMLEFPHTQKGLVFFSEEKCTTNIKSIQRGSGRSIVIRSHWLTTIPHSYVKKANRCDNLQHTVASNIYKFLSINIRIATTYSIKSTVKMIS